MLRVLLLFLRLHPPTWGPRTPPGPLLASTLFLFLSLSLSLSLYLSLSLLLAQASADTSGGIGRFCRPSAPHFNLVLVLLHYHYYHYYHYYFYYCNFF